MRRKVKIFRRTKNGKVYEYPWIGYSFRNKNGVPDFKREVCLKGLPPDVVAGIDRALRGEEAGSGAKGVAFLGAVSIGAEWAAFRIAEQLGIVQELERLQPKTREAVLCMVLDRVLNPRPYSKRALYTAVPTSGLERVVCPEGLSAKRHDFYLALEQLHDAQESIEKGLFRRRKQTQAPGDQLFLYDVTSSYLEGDHCALASFGYNRDGVKGRKQIVIGVLTDSEGLPVSAEVFEGSTSDQSTVLLQIEKMRKRFGVKEMVFVGDRGMLTSARRRELDASQFEWVRYITALPRREMLRLLDDASHPLQPGLFDERDLAEIEHEGVRYVLCRNPEKTDEDRRTRERLLSLTEEKLEMVRRNVESGRWRRREVIASHLHRWWNRWGMEKFFRVQYDEGAFQYERDEDRIREYEAVDGCYVIATDVPGDRLEADEVRRRYRSLMLVEHLFRTLKRTDLCVRPVRHWNAKRVKGHVFMCVLAYMIVWKARRLFARFLGDVESDETTRSNRAALFDSLRHIWDRLAAVQIGSVRLDGCTIEQLNPVAGDAREILKAASAFIDAPARKRLRLEV
jgi:hypothetical protein